MIKSATMTDAAAKAFTLDKATISRTLPFALFMAFIAVEEPVRLAVHRQWISLPEEALYYLYPVKTLVVLALLIGYRNQYRELDLADLGKLATTAAVCVTGFATFAMWICLDWSFTVTGPHKGFDPNLLPEGVVRLFLTAVRVAGAVLVVPLMEELFWRSFLLRYLVDSDFESVPLGRFTWGSFLVSTVLFGLEHNLIVAGIVAGAVYSIILYRTKSLAQCVLAHAVTNLSLAGYVLYTGKWYFW